MLGSCTTCLILERERHDVEAGGDVLVGLHDRLEQVHGVFLLSDERQVRPGLAAVAAHLVAARAGQHGVVEELIRAGPRIAARERRAIRRNVVAARGPCRLLLRPAGLHGRRGALLDRIEQFHLRTRQHLAGGQAIHRGHQQLRAFGRRQLRDRLERRLLLGLRPFGHETAHDRQRARGSAMRRDLQRGEPQRRHAGFLGDFHRAHHVVTAQRIERLERGRAHRLGRRGIRHGRRERRRERLDPEFARSHRARRAALLPAPCLTRPAPRR